MALLEDPWGHAGNGEAQGSPLGVDGALPEQPFAKVAQRLRRLGTFCSDVGSGGLAAVHEQLRESGEVVLLLAAGVVSACAVEPIAQVALRVRQRGGGVGGGDHLVAV